MNNLKKFYLPSILLTCLLFIVTAIFPSSVRADYDAGSVSGSVLCTDGTWCDTYTLSGTDSNPVSPYSASYDCSMQTFGPCYTVTNDDWLYLFVNFCGSDSSISQIISDTNPGGYGAGPKAYYTDLDCTTHEVDNFSVGGRYAYPGSGFSFNFEVGGNNYNNSVIALGYVVENQPPDLVPTNLSPSSTSPAPGQSMTFTADTKNQAGLGGSAGASTTYFGVRYTGSSSWLATQSFSIGSLGPGSSTTSTSSSWNVPSDAGGKSLDFCVIVDFYNNVQENAFGGEANNEACTSFTVQNPSSPPTVDSLNINNAGNTSFGGVSRTSGNLAGSNAVGWNNPINVTLNAHQGSAPIKQYYVLFSPGFEVVYDTASELCGSNYCYNSGGWHPLDLYNGTPIGGTSVQPIQNSSSWQVRFNPSFGNQHITTSGYVKDNNNLCDPSPCGNYKSF